MYPSRHTHAQITSHIKDCEFACVHAVRNDPLRNGHHMLAGGVCLGGVTNHIKALSPTYSKDPREVLAKALKFN